MKPLKDNRTAEYKGQSNTNEIKGFSGYELPNYYNVPEHQGFVDCAHKSQKITTAIYMITELIPETDPLVHQLRSHAVEIMNTLHLLTTLPQAQRVQELSHVSTLIYGFSSSLNVLHHTGKVSHMNYSLMSNELSSLQQRVNVLLTKSLPYDRQQRSSQVVNEFSFSDDFFKTSTGEQRISSPVKDTPRTSSAAIKDTKDTGENSVKDTKRDSLKDTPKLNTISVAPQRSETLLKNESNPQGELKKNRQNSKGHSSEKAKATKEVRHENILKILKQKKDAKIGDITSLITDYGSKTIQRDLTELVDQGLVTKEGDRRWSVYNLAY